MLRSKSAVEKDIANLQKQYPHLSRSDCIHYLALEGAKKSSTLVVNSSGGGRLEKFCYEKRIGAYKNIPIRSSEQKQEVKHSKDNIAFICGMIVNVLYKFRKNIKPDSIWNLSEDLDRQTFQLRKEICNMLPSGTGSPSTTTKKDGIPTLTNEQLSTSAKKVKILGIKAVDGRFGKQIKAKVAVDGSMYFWYLNLKSPQWEVLKGKFGLDENEYVGVEVLLSLEKDDFEERYFVAVDFPKVKGKV